MEILYNLVYLLKVAFNSHHRYEYEFKELSSSMTCFYVRPFWPHWENITFGLVPQKVLEISSPNFLCTLGIIYRIKFSLPYESTNNWLGIHAKAFLSSKFQNKLYWQILWHQMFFKNRRNEKILKPYLDYRLSQADWHIDKLIY